VNTTASASNWLVVSSNCRDSTRPFFTGKGAAKGFGGAVNSFYFSLQRNRDSE